MHPSQIKFASLYDAQYQDYSDDLPFWMAMMERYDGPVLELGCGTARVLSPVLETGVFALGLDKDLAMLRLARSHLAERAGRRDQASYLVCMDMLFIGLHAQFALAIAPLNTLATVDDESLLRILRQLGTLLDPHAGLACELPNPSTALDPEHDPQDILDSYLLEGGEIAVQVQANTPAALPGVQRVVWTYSMLYPEGQVQRFELVEDYYLRSPDALANLCKEAGFRIAETYGEYDLRTYDQASPRMLVVLERER